MVWKKTKNQTRVCWALCLAQGLDPWHTRAAKPGSGSSKSISWSGILQCRLGTPSHTPGSLVELFKAALSDSPEPSPASLQNQERATALEHPVPEGTSKGQGWSLRILPLGLQQRPPRSLSLHRLSGGGFASLPFLRFPFQHQTGQLSREPDGSWPHSLSQLLSLSQGQTFPRLLKKQETLNPPPSLEKYWLIHIIRKESWTL